MTFAEQQARALLERYTEKWSKQLEGVEQPAWVKAGIALIKRANNVETMLRAAPIISVQPMTRPVGGIAFYRPDRDQWEPSAVDRLAALAEPNGELAQRIETYDGEMALRENL